MEDIYFELGLVYNYQKKDPFNPLPDVSILDWSKLKQIADNILKCI